MSDYEYFRLCKEALYGDWKENRTGVRTTGYIGDFVKYDLSKGFPILTTKTVAFKSVVAEMLSFLRGYSNVKDFNKLGCRVWDMNAQADYWASSPYCAEEGDLGKLYGVRWRCWRNWSKKKSLTKEIPVSGIPELPFKKKTPELDFSSNNAGLVGKTFDNCGNPYTVFKEEREEKGKHLKYHIFFERSGFCTTVQKQQILRTESKIYDPYLPSICGVACRGVVDRGSFDKLYSIWHDMIHRCYGENRDNNKWYKDAGVKVSDRWLVFENFVKDYKLLPRWELKEVFPEDYSLDKDVFISNIYDVSTCRWSSKKEQNTNSSQVPSFKAIGPDGNVYFGRGSSAFSEEFNLSKGMVKQCVQGRYKSHRGWRFEKSDEEYVYTETDQLKEVVAKLKLGIDDRRLIVNAWHPSELNEQVLPCCHLLYQFGLSGGKLHLSLYQRSCDLPLGVPFNVAGYAWLLSVIAHITNHRVGYLNHFMHDIHIYENQIPGVIEQLNRDPKEKPELVINPMIQSLEDLETWVTADDFWLEGYDPHPPIKFPFAV